MMKKSIQRWIAMTLVLFMIGGDAAIAAEGVLKLPQALKVIEEEAFAGNTSLDKVILPDKAEEIGKRAFADSSIREIEIPSSVSSIAADAFENSQLESIVAEEGSYAYSWAVDNDYIEEEDPLAPVVAACTLENGTGIHLEWEKQEGTLEDYRIDWSTQNFADEKDFYYAYVWENNTYTIYGLKPETMYYVRITAYDHNSQAHTSESLSMKTSSPAQNIPITGLSVSGQATDVYWKSGSKNEIDFYSRSMLDVTPVNATNQQFRWVSSNPTIASVDENTGIITCNNYGWTEITAYTTDGSGLSLTGLYSVTTDCPQNMEIAVEGTSLAVSWSEVANADFYYLNCYDPVSGYDYWTDEVDELEYTFNDLQPDTEYQVSLWSGIYLYEDVLFSWDCTFDFVTTGESPIASISCDKEEAYIGDTVTWTAQYLNEGGPYKYHFSVWLNGQRAVEYFNSGSSSCSFTVDELGEYYVTVKVKDASGNQVYEMRSKIINALDPEATHVKQFDWINTTGNKAKILRYTGTDTQVVIPSVVGRYKVTEIGDWAFSKNTNLTSVTIPEGVHSIGRDAFNGCSNLTDVHLPESLRTIDEYAFYFCSSLHNLTIPDGVTSIISQYSNIFYGCDDLIIYCNAGTTAATEVTNVEKRFVDPDYPNLFLSQRTQNSEKYLTVKGYTTDVSSLSIPASIGGVPITQIANEAFINNTNLIDIVFEGSLTSIGYSAFSGCSNLANIVFTGTLTSIANYAFNECNNLTCITLPDGLQSIGSFVFNNCSRLTKIVIPDSITVFQKLNSLAFSGCENLVIYCNAGNAVATQISSLQGKFIDQNYPDLFLSQSKQNSEYYLVVKGCAEDVTRLSIPSTINNVPITQIAERAFENNKNLTNVVLNDHVTFIGREAFCGCKNLSSLILPDNITSFGWNAFSSCDKLIIYCNAGTVTASQITAENQEFIDPSYPTLRLKQRSLDSGYYLTVIGCIRGITSVCIPRTINNIPVTHIDDHAFKYSGEITNIYLSEGLTTIGAFEGCYNLIELIIPESVKSISYYPFPYSWDGQLYVYKGSYGEEWCIEHRYEYNYVTTPPTPPDVTLPTLPEGENSDFVFTLRYNEIEIIGYTGTATDIIIPSKIGMYPVTEISEYTFADKYKITSIILPEGLKRIDAYAFENCTGLTQIQFPDSMEYIVEGAFHNCTNLSEIDIKNWECCFANSPGSSVFAGTNIKTIKIPEGVTKIPSNIFCSTKSLTNVTLPSTLKRIGSSAFSSCSGLTNIVLPEGLTEIGWWAFEHCTELTQVVLPSTLEEVGDYAFYNCGDPLFIVKEGTFAEEWCLKNNYRHDYHYIVPSETLNIIFPAAGSTIEAAASTICWTGPKDAYYYKVELRDMTENPENADSGERVLNLSEYYRMQVELDSSMLKRGHTYRVWIAAYTSKDEVILQKERYFKVREDEAGAIPSCSIATSSVETQMNQYVYFKGKVYSNGGEFERISIDIMNTAGERCYYQTYDASEIMTIGGNLTEFDLSNVDPLETGKIIRGNYYTDEENQKSMDLTKTGTYHIRVWAYNAGNAEAHIVSVYTLNLLERSDVDTESQIFYFISEKEQGYRNTYHTMSAETTGDIVKVELYIDGYQTKPEITETEWMGYRFFDIKTMIHEPGTRLAELKAYNTKGECLTAKTTIVVLDADYEKIDMPKWNSPLPFEADGAIHGVAGYPFVAVWNQSENVKAEKFSVRIWSAELQQYTFEGETSTPSIDIPATALPAPGDYTLALIAIKEGYDNSDILTQRIIAFDTYEASIQAECPHSTWTEQNIRVEYRDHSIKEIAGHYSKETFDMSCLTCGLILNKNVADSEYQFFEHHLIDDLYCLCGYSIHESEIDTFQSFDAFVKGTYAANVYRAPAYQSDYGTVFPGETVYVYALVNGWYKISYDTSSGRKFGYIQPEKISPYIEFELKTEVNGDSIVYEDVRYVDGEYYTSEILLPFGSLENGGLKGEWFCSDYSSDEAIGNNEHEWLITFDFSNAKEGETRECPVSVNPYIGIAATVSRAANAPISSITAKLLGGVVHFNLKQLCKLCGLRMKGHSVIPLPENYALEYQKEIEQASKELKMLFECQMREKDALYSGLTTFQAHIWPSMFYMGLWDGIRHDLRKFASTHIYDEIYNGDLLIRGMLMQKTQEYDSAFTDGLKIFATICENIVDNLSDGIAKRYDIYEMVRMLIDKDWKDGDFSVFIKQVEQFDPYGSISVEEFFNHDAVKIQIYDIYGDTLNAAEINKLKNLMSKWEGKLAKFLKSSHLQAASDILKMAPDVITEVQWQMLESSYKEIYLDYLDEWIAIEADPKMKKAYQNLKNDLEDEMADFTGFIDRTLFQSDIAGKAIRNKAQQWGSYFVHELVEKGKFGDKIKLLWEKKGMGLTNKFNKVLATAELANTVAECGLFIIQLTGLSLEDAKQRSEEITITWNAYDTNVRSMVQKLEDLNETSYQTVIASMKNCTNLLNYLFKLYGDEKEAAWDFQISNSEVASFRDSNQQYINDINKAIENFEELIEEYYDFIN